MPTPYCFDIETLIHECQPSSVLAIGSGADPVIDTYREQNRQLGRECRVDRLAPNRGLESIKGRYDLGIVSDALEHMEKLAAMRLLSRLRDLHTARFCATVRIGKRWPGLASTWARNELLAIGMLLVSSHDDDGGPVHLYKYDIATYKPAPSWLSPDDWAHPELWNKYRW